MRDNPIMDTYDEIVLRNELIEIYRKYTYNNLPIPKNVLKDLEEKAKNNQKIREDDLFNK